MIFDPNDTLTPQSGLFGLLSTPEESRVVLLPVPWDVTTSYGGGRGAGPTGNLASKPQLDLFDLGTSEACYINSVADNTDQ